MAGTAPTDFHFTRMLDAGPVHCSVWCGDPPVTIDKFFQRGRDGKRRGIVHVIESGAS